MNPSVRRQIKDIQHRAENLINGRPSLADIEDFDQYNEELKAFLLENITDRELLDRVVQIPRVLEETQAQQVASNLIISFLAYFTTGLVAYFRDRQRVENAMGNIREAQGKYSSIEFLSGNLD